jgi:hypothetical protein
VVDFWKIGTPLQVNPKANTLPYTNHGDGSMVYGVSELLLLLLIIIAALGIYFTPTIVAAMLGKQNLRTIFIMNLSVAWTGVGWIVALILALRRPKVEELLN